MDTGYAQQPQMMMHNENQLMRPMTQGFSGARPKVISRGGPKRVSAVPSGQDYFSQGMSSAVTRDPYREFM